MIGIISIYQSLFLNFCRSGGLLNIRITLNNILAGTI